MTVIMKLEMNGRNEKIVIRGNKVDQGAIRMAFQLDDDVIGLLYFMLNNEEICCCYEPPFFYLPEGWENIKFTVRATPSRRTNRISETPVPNVINIQLLGQNYKLANSSSFTVSETSIRTALLLPKNAAIRLSYLVDGQKCFCEYEGQSFILPTSHESLKFIVDTDKPPGKPVEEEEEPPRKKSRIDGDESIIKDIIWFQSLQKYALYYKDSSNIKHCVTPISKNLVAIYAPERGLNATERSLIIIRSSIDQNYQVPAKFIGVDRAIGLVVLKSIDTVFGEDDIPMTEIKLHMEYMMLGLPTPSIGEIEGIGHQSKVYGSSKYSEKYNGAGVWDRSSQLIGMQIKGVRTTLIPAKVIVQKADEWLKSGVSRPRNRSPSIIVLSEPSSPVHIPCDSPIEEYSPRYIPSSPVYSPTSSPYNNFSD